MQCGFFWKNPQLKGNECIWHEHLKLWFTSFKLLTGSFLLILWYIFLLLFFSANCLLKINIYHVGSLSLLRFSKNSQLNLIFSMTCYDVFMSLSLHKTPRVQPILTTTFISTSVAAVKASAAKIIPAAIFLRGLKDTDMPLPLARCANPLQGRALQL